jgi:hypothetical protein
MGLTGLTPWPRPPAAAMVAHHFAPLATHHSANGHPRRRANGHPQPGAGDHQEPSRERPLSTTAQTANHASAPS